MSDYINYNVKVYPDGSKKWFLNGQLHRVGGHAVEYANGTKSWYLNDKLHREDGPAVEWAHGTKEWYLNGELHREGGPAIEWADGTKEWYLNGVRYIEEEYLKKMKERSGPTCEGKVVEIEGKKYKLTLV